MDDWGDPWQDAHAPKRPPAIDIHILGAQASKERVVTPVLTGFFEDQAKWSEPDTHDVWASSAHDEPSPPLRPQVVADAPSWSLPGPDAAEADKHADPHGTGVSTAQPAPPASDPSQPAEEAASNTLTVDIPFQEATLPSDAPEDPGAPPATPTAPDVDSSDSGTTIGPDPAGYTALEPSTPPATRPPSGEFESGISTRPSTSPSEVSHDVCSDSPRTSLDEDIEPPKSSANIKPVECTEKEESEVVAGAETKAEAEDTTATLPSVDDTTKDTTTDTPAGTAEDAVEATAKDETEDTTKPSPDDKPDDAANETNENTFDNDDDDFDDFGDFEEETDEPVVEEETADTVASPVEPEPSRTGNVLASALDLNGTPPDSPRPIIKSDFEPDLNLIGKLFPDADSKNDLPEVEDSPIKPTNARKAWYRLTRIETMREIGSGKNHDSYVRVGWRDSDVRTEVNQIVGRWASEDRINGRTLLGGKPGATFGWDYPMPSPASSVFSMNSHKRNASAATTPRKAVFDLEETKQRPVSLSVPPPRKPSISTAIDIPQFSWSSAPDEPQEPAASSAPPSKTTFASSNGGDNPWANPFADSGSAHDSLPVSAPPVKTSFEEKIDSPAGKNSFEDSHAWGPEKTSFEETDAWKPAKTSFEETDAWKPEKTSFEEADSWKSTKSSFEETNAWEPGKTSLEQISDWKPKRSSSEKMVDQRPAHTRTVSDSGIHITSPFDNPFAPEPEPSADPTPNENEEKPVDEKKKKKRLSWFSFPKRKKNNDSAHKRAVSNASFLSVSSGLSVPAKSASLPSWESPWGRTAPKSPLANEVSLPDPDPEIARKEHEPEIPLRKHEPNPWDNAWDNAWNDARLSTAKSNTSHHESDALTKPSSPKRSPRPPSPKFETPAPTPKLPAIQTSPQLTKTKSSVEEDKSWDSVVESPMASPAIMSPDENPWGDPWKPTSVGPAPVTLSVEPPSASKPATKLAPLDTSVKSHEMDDDDDEWGEMVESPAASSPVIAPPPSGQWGLPRSISPINLPMSKATRTHPPSPLVPEPIRSATMPISPTTSGILNPPKSSAWLPKPTSGRTSPAKLNPPRPLSPLNPARSSTLPVSPSNSSLPSLSPWLQPQSVPQPPAAPAPAATSPPAASDPWASVDFSIFDKPAPPRISPTASSHNRTSSSPTFMTHQSAQPSTATPVITFDAILGGRADRDRSSSQPITFDQILQPQRSGSATTFDDILTQPGQLSPATSQTDLKAAAAGQALARSPSPAGGWAEQDKEAVKKFVAGLPDLGYMLR